MLSFGPFSGSRRLDTGADKATNRHRAGLQVTARVAAHTTTYDVLQNAAGEASGGYSCTSTHPCTRCLVC